MAAGMAGAWLVARVPWHRAMAAASASSLHPREQGQHVLLAVRVCWSRLLLAVPRWCFAVCWDRGNEENPDSQQKGQK